MWRAAEVVRSRVGAGCRAAFTEQLLRVWNHGLDTGDYSRFHTEIKAGMEATQTPNLFTLGPVAAFVEQDPFTV